MNTQSKVAIVTGSSRGIGASIGKRLAADGIAVIINYAGRSSDAEQVVQEIQSAGGRAKAVQADVSNSSDITRLFGETQATFGRIDILVNNAGVMQPGMVSLADTDDALYERIVNTNLKGTFLTLRQAAKDLREGGRIVNISTSIIGLGQPGYSVYAASKSAVETMTNIFAKELRGRSITVNAVAPGPTGTDLFFKGKSEEQIEKFSKIAPLERLGRPEDIADVVAFLVGPQGGWVNGQTIRVNGGMV